jgi:hypothetical protein
MSTQDQANPPRATSADIVGIGIAFALGGIYFILVAMDVVPPPGEANGPPAVVFCAGLAFLLAGLTCMVRAKAGMADHHDDVPDAAPLWLKLSYRALGIGVAGALALIGTWIAIGGGPRAFTLSSPFGEMHTTGELIGRSVFGLGAVVVWIYVIALTVGTVRKFFGSSSVTPAERSESRNP